MIPFTSQTSSTPFAPEPLYVAILPTRKRAPACVTWGNIAWRSGQTINVDPGSGKILGDNKLQALAGRSYQPGWEPKV
jgi:hypothetical protein